MVDITYLVTSFLEIYNSNPLVRSNCYAFFFNLGATAVGSLIISGTIEQVRSHTRVKFANEILTRLHLACFATVFYFIATYSAPTVDARLFAIFIMASLILLYLSARATNTLANSKIQKLHKCTFRKSYCDVGAEQMQVEIGGRIYECKHPEQQLLEYCASDAGPLLILRFIWLPLLLILLDISFVLWQCVYFAQLSQPIISGSLSQ